MKKKGTIKGSLFWLARFFFLGTPEDFPDHNKKNLPLTITINDNLPPVACIAGRQHQSIYPHTLAVNRNRVGYTGAT